MLDADIGIDLGTSSVLVYLKDQGIVLKEPSVVAIDKTTRNIQQIGEAARRMIGKTPPNIIAIRPLREGVISDFDMTEKMLRYFIKKSLGRHFLRKPRIAVCVPSSVTRVEQKAVEDATKNAGAREVFIIEEPIAAAIGAGIDIARACGSMIVDIGGGTTDVAVISLGYPVVSNSLKIAGDSFDEAVVKYMRKHHNLLIGDKTAESVKINIGTACERQLSVFMDVHGRDLLTGLPSTINVNSDEIYEALKETVENIIQAIHSVLERTPPELSSDIYERGIVMTGGGSLLHGLDKVIKQRTGINAVIANDPISCVAIGTGKYIEYASKNDVIGIN